MPPHHRMRAFDRDLIRGGHYGQRSCEPRLKGRTHGCTDQALRREILLANSEPSTRGTKRPIADEPSRSALKGKADEVFGGPDSLSYALIRARVEAPLTLAVWRRCRGGIFGRGLGCLEWAHCGPAGRPQWCLRSAIHWQMTLDASNRAAPMERASNLARSRPRQAG